MNEQVKPRLRGVFHQVAFFIALGLGGWLVHAVPSGRATTAAAIYAASLVTLFGVSALYHRRNWGPVGRARMRRLDHAAIFVMIGGNYTPFALTVPPASGTRLLLTVWGVAAVGIARELLWPQSPKWMIAIIYIAAGWVGLIYVFSSLSRVDTVLMLVAGGAYSLGAVCYARKQPNPVPGWFGYHELFHLLTLVASACLFVIVTHVML